MISDGVKIRLEVSPQAIKNTTRCKKDFACLSGQGTCLCKLKFCFNGKSYFVSCDKDMLCNYKVCFGNSILCACPTRKEIYNRYNI